MTLIGAKAMRTGLRGLAARLNSTDVLLIVFWLVLSLVSLVFHSRIELWGVLIAANAAASALVIWLAHVAWGRPESKVLRWTHEWIAFPLVVFTYKQLYFMISPLHGGRDYDQLLMAADRALFGLNPTELLASFSHPVVTEILQISYSLFYAIFIALGIELCRRKDIAAFRHFRFSIVYGFLVSYLGYFFLPAVGPRFTIHEFSRIDQELPGLIFTPALRWFINIGESITPAMSDAVAMASSQRDVFPSGHTMITLMAVALAYRYRCRIRRHVAVLGCLLIIATVYLRYHYVIDLVAGGVLAIPCLLTSERLENALTLTAETPEAAVSRR